MSNVCVTTLRLWVLNKKKARRAKVLLCCKVWRYVHSAASESSSNCHIVKPCACCTTHKHYKQYGRLQLYKLTRMSGLSQLNGQEIQVSQA